MNVRSDLSPWGDPIDAYWIDPPRTLDPALAAILLPYRVAFLTDHRGIVHVIDWLDNADYPTPDAFMDEVCRNGLTRPVPPPAVASLTRASRIILVHDRACRGQWWWQPLYSPGMFARFPITALSVARTADAPTLRAARRSVLTLVIEEE